jgi:hypothetical protein
MTTPGTNPPKVDEIFQQSEWKAQAEKPGTLEQIGHKWDETLSTKGQIWRS